MNASQYLEYEQLIASKMKLLNDSGVAIIFVVTGMNGAGKTRLSKLLLTNLPFHQSFNLGIVSKTIRCLTRNSAVSYLENFYDNKDRIFSDVIRYASKEYQKNGVNVIIEGVQIDTKSLCRANDILGGVILNVDNDIKILRNDKPDTHFKRKLRIGSDVDTYHYIANDYFITLDNNRDIMDSYHDILDQINYLLDTKLSLIPRKKLVYEPR